jgi:putative DNA primase/helicase
MSHDPSLLLTKVANVAPREMPTPVWDKFLCDITLGNERIIRYLQALFGYGLCGDRREQKFALWIGKGNDGKGTCISTIQSAVGSGEAGYSYVASQDFITESIGDRHPTEIADLPGKRFLFVNETAANKQLNETLIKNLTGEDEIKGRRMRQDFFGFLPQVLPIISGNYNPRLRNPGKALRRRMMKLLWELSLPEEAEDKTLRERLKAELPGILWWMLQGTAIWVEEGLVIPDEVKQATREYLGAEDLFGEWFEEKAIANPEGEESRAKAYTDFVQWCNEHHEQRIPSRTWFNDNAESHGFQKTMGGTRAARFKAFKGMQLRNPNGFTDLDTGRSTA